MTEELDKQYTHLEDRVKLRTKELKHLKFKPKQLMKLKLFSLLIYLMRTPLNGILGMTSIAMEEEDLM